MNTNLDTDCDDCDLDEMIEYYQSVATAGTSTTCVKLDLNVVSKRMQESSALTSEIETIIEERRNDTGKIITGYMYERGIGKDNDTIIITLATLDKGAIGLYDRLQRLCVSKVVVVIVNNFIIEDM